MQVEHASPCILLKKEQKEKNFKPYSFPEFELNLSVMVAG